MVVGLFALALGWMCLDHVARVRALYSEEHPPHSRFHGQKPLMIFPSALGVLFVLDGLALLTLAAVERLQNADMVGSSEMIVALVPVSVSIAALVLLPRLTGRRGRWSSENKCPERGQKDRARLLALHDR